MSYWVLECKFRYLLSDDETHCFFFKIGVEISLSSVFTYVKAKLNEAKRENSLYICHTFCISYNKNIGSK